MAESARLLTSPHYHSQFKEETGAQKFTRRLKEEPLIPLGEFDWIRFTYDVPGLAWLTLPSMATGCAATCYALYRAYRSMRAGDSAEMNRMFRARIYAQAFTLVALVAGGMYFKTERQQRREFEKAVEERKAQEKRDAWLRELEIRDKEDREWRERHAAIEAAAKEAGQRPSSKEPDAARSAIEPSEERSIGVLDAVRTLLSRED